MSNFLDETGLASLWDKIKEYSGANLNIAPKYSPLYYDATNKTFNIRLGSNLSIGSNASGETVLLSTGTSGSGGSSYTFRDGISESNGEVYVDSDYINTHVVDFAALSRSSDSVRLSTSGEVGRWVTSDTDTYGKYISPTYRHPWSSNVFQLAVGDGLAEKYMDFGGQKAKYIGIDHDDYFYIENGKLCFSLFSDELDSTVNGEEHVFSNALQFVSGTNAGTGETGLALFLGSGITIGHFVSDHNADQYIYPLEASLGEALAFDDKGRVKVNYDTNNFDVSSTNVFTIRYSENGGVMSSEDGVTLNIFGTDYGNNAADVMVVKNGDDYTSLPNAFGIVSDENYDMGGIAVFVGDGLTINSHQAYSNDEHTAIEGQTCNVVEADTLPVGTSTDTSDTESVYGILRSVGLVE